MTEDNTLTIYVNGDEITIEANEIAYNYSTYDLVIILNHSLVNNSNIQSFMEDLKLHDKRESFYHNHIRTRNTKRSLKRILKLWIDYYCHSKNNVVAEIYINGIRIEEPVISKAQNMQNLITRKIYKGSCSLM